MGVRFNCIYCGRALRAGNERIGRRIRCPQCKEIVKVPQPQSWSRPPVSIQVDDGDQLNDGDYDAPIKLRRKPLDESEIDMTPMVDMTFLLLIFFMITASFNLQKSIEIPAPQENENTAQSKTIEQLETDDDFIIVRVDEDSIYWVEGRQTASENEMLIQLRELRRGGGDHPPTKLLVLASGSARHERVVGALDAGTEVGMEDIRLSSDPEESF